MYRKLKAIACLIALVICAGTVFADSSENLNKMIDKYSQQEIIFLDVRI
jgi:D-mannonate dehydratase